MEFRLHDPNHRDQMLYFIKKYSIISLVRGCFDTMDFRKWGTCDFVEYKIQTLYRFIESIDLKAIYKMMNIRWTNWEEVLFCFANYRLSISRFWINKDIRQVSPSILQFVLSIVILHLLHRIKRKQHAYLKSYFCSPERSESHQRIW